MFEKFTTVDARDFRQRYNGSYGFFRKGGKKWLVQLVEINSDRDPPVVRFNDKDGQTFTLLADEPSDDVGFEFLPPRSSWKNTHSFGAVLSKRIVRRQWIRGLHDSNTSFSILNVKAIPVGFPILNELFLQQPPSFMDAFRALLDKSKKDNVYAAVSNSFAIDGSRVYCFEKAIGKYTNVDGEFIVELDDPIFRTEIYDAFRRNHVGVTVK